MEKVKHEVEETRKVLSNIKDCPKCQSHKLAVDVRRYWGAVNGKVTRDFYYSGWVCPECGTKEDNFKDMLKEDKMKRSH